MSSIPNCVKVQDESASGRTTLTPERSLTDQPTENKFYFFQNLTFRAEDELFQVPALYFLGESHFFREMFELPPPEGQPLEGSSKECPLVLEGIRAMEFQALLKVMFPRTFGKAEILSKDEWEGVLKLSDMWNMQTIKELAITNLTPILLEDPIARIVFARKYNVGRWLTPAYVDLVRRQEHIGVEDLEAIGTATALRICSLRERCVRETKIEKTYDSYHGYHTQNKTSKNWSLTPTREPIAASDISGLEGHVEEVFGKAE
ncbi:hypothetical protein CC2G_008599 [Coprinopsis cinerea AmutBmut pab1-1]|nr:hypothetical protein CC2G_008599 [Coprinopsis cinerea AmutBmut pab1-1]